MTAKTRGGSCVQKLTGKVAIITGASRGIGAAIAKGFAANGAKIVVNFRSNQVAAQAVVAAIQAAGGEAIAVAGNVSVGADVDALIAAACRAYGQVDILVNNAGWAKLQPLAEIERTAIDAQLATNVTGLILMTQAAARVMKTGGTIINVSSIAAKGGPGGSVYSATKAAANALTKCYAAELGPKGITVNAIAPAAVETDLYFEVGLDQNHETSLSATPLGWIGSVEDVARAALFFASDDAAWITGEVLHVSGGKAM